MELQELYKQYRNEQMIFVNEKIIKSLEREAIINSAKALDMIDDKGNIIYDDESDLNYILDFAIYEYKINGKNAVERYAEKHAPENEMEERALKALLNSYTSLYRVVNISPSKPVIFLKDTFNQSKNIRLVDISLSKTMGISSLIYTRVLPYPELNMTSGAPMIFDDSLETSLTSSYMMLAKEKIEDSSANKYIFFYNAYRMYGLEMGFSHTHHHEHDHHHDHHGHHHHGHHHH
ncbi:hypothetical protein [Fonticella tunisiensis]|uniref:Uncharacterized protein n=1 Tax=Fonticella tunisiensis TaxID=1096341 RepID=A0A4R7KQC0_9CLOT|nr:hypothetical protein [Fonticella tunisiensis]TDT58467.1 hypothetical protein EDD71_111119 [Fonticella tunisiensis]